MSRTDAHVPFEVRLERGDLRPHQYRVAGGIDGVDFYPRLRFYTNVTGEDIHLRYRVPERQAVRASLHRVLRQTRAPGEVGALAFAGLVIDDSKVEVRPQRRNQPWGGGWFD